MSKSLVIPPRRTSPARPMFKGVTCVPDAFKRVLETPTGIYWTPKTLPPSLDVKWFIHPCLRVGLGLQNLQRSCPAGDVIVTPAAKAVFRVDLYDSRTDMLGVARRG